MFSSEVSGELNIYFVGLDNTIHAFSINQIDLESITHHFCSVCKQIREDAFSSSRL